MAKRQAPILTPEQRARQVAKMTETMRAKTYDPAEMARRARLGHAKRRANKEHKDKYPHDEMSRRARLAVEAKRRIKALQLAQELVRVLQA